MKFNFLGNKKDKARYFIAVDIDKEIVKILVFKRENEKIIILGNYFQYFDNLSVFDLISFERDLFKKTISNAINEACQKSTEKPPKLKEIFVVLSLPPDILKAKILSQSLKRSNPKIEIQGKEEKDIYQTVLKESQKRISIESYGLLPEDMEFIKMEILESKIDGYEVSYLKGFKGENLRFDIMTIFLPKYYSEYFKKLFKEIGLKNLKIVHPVQNLKLAFPQDFFDGIFLKIGLDYTQILASKEGEIFYISEFENGEKNFTQVLSQTLGINEKEAKNLKEKYSKRILSEGVRKRIREIIELPLQNWFSDLKLKLKEVEKIPLPSIFFIFCEENLLPEIQKILEDGEWEDIVFFQEPDTRLICSKDLKNIEDRNAILNNPQWISPVLICYSS